MKRTLAIHPVLIGVWPILALYSANLEMASSRELFVPVLAVTCVTLLFWSMLSCLVGGRERAGLMVSLALLLYTSYVGLHTFAYRVVQGHNVEVILFLIWSALFVSCMYLSFKVRKHLQNLTKIFNVIALSLLLLPAIQIGAGLPRPRVTLPVMRDDEILRAVQRLSADVTAPPNVYYIVLDGYARGDILKELYDCNNSEFLDDLTQMGFYVADRSRSNYCQTVLSLASTMNLEYLDGLVQEIGDAYNSRLPLTQMITDSRIVHLLRQAGYTFVAFSSGYEYTEIRQADLYVRTGHLGLFTNAVITASVPKSLAKNLTIQYDIHRRSILRTFRGLEKSTELKGPVLVFAHILVPHPPFVFERDGKEHLPSAPFGLSDGSHFIRQDEHLRRQYVRAYTNQLVFTNKMVRNAITEILARSERPPVIILQADHGPGSLLDCENPRGTCHRERMGILNAYYLPAEAGNWLYDSITPVNTFRVVLNCCFGTDLTLLEDRCYFSTWSRPYTFLDVTTESAPGPAPPAN